MPIEEKQHWVPGAQVRVGVAGTFTFTVNSIDPGLAMIEVNADSDVTYEWPVRVSDLIPAGD